MILKQNGKYHGTKKAYQYVEVQRARRLSYMQHAIMHSASSQRAPKKSNCVIHLVVFVHTVRTRLRCSIVSSSIKTCVWAWDKICGFCPPPPLFAGLVSCLHSHKKTPRKQQKKVPPPSFDLDWSRKNAPFFQGRGERHFGFFCLLALVFWPSWPLFWRDFFSHNFQVSPQCSHESNKKTHTIFIFLLCHVLRRYECVSLGRLLNLRREWAFLHRQTCVRCHNCNCSFVILGI